VLLLLLLLMVVVVMGFFSIMHPFDESVISIK